MRFTCEKSQLLQGLNIAGRTVAQKSALSALEGVLCKAGSGLTLTGYNMETAITYQIAADVVEDGECVFPKLTSNFTPLWMGRAWLSATAKMVPFIRFFSWFWGMRMGWPVLTSGRSGYSSADSALMVKEE